jgi:hypothetical protein
MTPVNRRMRTAEGCQFGARDNVVVNGVEQGSPARGRAIARTPPAVQSDPDGAMKTHKDTRQLSSRYIPAKK